MFVAGQINNPDGRPVGSKNKITSLRDELASAFKRNHDKATAMLDAMFENKKDFQWLCTLHASLEPKKLESDGSFAPKMIMINRNPQAVKEELERKLLGDALAKSD